MTITAILLEIPSCSVEQVVGDKTITLAQGTLSLIQDLDEASISLSVPDIAFILRKDSPAYTHVDNPRWYFFTLPEATGSYVKVVLPDTPGPGSLEEKLQEQFEEILIQQGMLQTGLKAVGDELGASAKHQAAVLSNTITSQANDSHILSKPPTDSPATFSPATHTVAEGAASTTHTASTYTARAAEVFANATIGIGEKVAELLGGTTQDAPNKSGDRIAEQSSAFEEAGVDRDQALTKDPLAQVAEQAWASTKTTGQDAWNATKTAAGGAGDGVQAVADTTTTEAERVIEHDYGKEASDLSDKAGETATNVKNIAKDITVNTTKVVQNVAAAAKPGDPNGPVYTV